MKIKLLYVFGISFLALFLEFCLIRWLPSQVRALAYFKNLVLISSFLGLGLGFLLARRARWLPTILPLLLLAEVTAAIILGQFRITGRENPDEHLWLLYFDLPQSALPFPLSVAIPIFYLLNTLTFIPFGQLLSVSMEQVGDPILAYLANVLGSIAGIGLFLLLSFIGAGPVYWFLPSLILYAVLVLRPSASGTSRYTLPHGNRVPVLFAFLGDRPGSLAALATIVVLALLPIEKPDTIWSPYYALKVKMTPAPEKDSPGTSGDIASPQSYLGFDLMVNGSFHQSAIDFREQTRDSYPPMEELYQRYAIPYQYYKNRVKEAPEDVLVIGAGTGNDVLIALQEGAARIDAVEIDPAILRLGEQLHPARVYDSPNVHRHVDDARNFLQNGEKQYDLIVFGTLDSQVALSALSTLRLDNYVYTVESLQQAKRRLKTGGVLAMYFWADEEWIRTRLIETVEQAFGREPEVILPRQPYLFNMVMMVGSETPPATASAAPPAPRTSGQVVTTDDWPYLYHREAALNPFYVGEILLLLVISAALVHLTLSPRFGFDPASAPLFHVPLFLQGIGFLLLETRSISVLSLLFGATWVVSAIVIVAVLFVLILANLATRVLNIRSLKIAFAGLAVTLLIGYIFPASLLLNQDLPLRLAGSVLIYLSPIFFSSIVFAVYLQDSDNIGWAYGSNVLGAVLGGFGEYIAVVTGLRLLSLLALAVFVPIALLRWRSGISERGTEVLRSA